MGFYGIISTQTAISDWILSQEGQKQPLTDKRKNHFSGLLCHRMRFYRLSTYIY